METWSIIDKSSSPEEFSNIVHHNEGISNFSVKIANILQTAAFRGVPIFNSTIRYPFVCIYFDNIVVIFSNTRCETVQLFKAFDCNISGLIIRKNEDVVIVVLESGILHKLNILSPNSSHSSSRITEDKFSKVLIYEEDSGSFILASNSLIYHRLTIFSTANDKPESENLCFDICRLKCAELDEKTALEIDLVDKQRKPVNASTVCIRPNWENNLFAICPITNQEVLLTDAFQAKCVVPFTDTDRFLLLKESSDGQELCVADLYTFCIEFNIPVSKYCVVIGGARDSAVYLDIKDNKIYIYQIQENSPLSQLEILISARNYEGAEAFAKLNNLSPAAVLELKAKCLMSNLKKQFSPEHLRELKDILSTCESVHFVLNCCLEGAQANINLSVLLEFGKEYLKSFNDQILKEKFNELMWKAELFNLMRYKEEENAMEWTNLTLQNPLSLLSKFLSNDQLDLACIVWVKCYPYIVHDLTQQRVSELLNSVMPDTKLNALLRWLEYFIPNVVDSRPFSTNLIIDWSKKKIVSLENSKHWPEIGLQLAEKLSPLIFGEKFVNVMSAEAEKFFFLIHCLKNIQTLKNSYNIIVSLKDFMCLGREELAKLILRKAFAEDLSSLLTDYLETYEMRHNINRDSLIKDHIEEIMNASPVVDENKMEILLQSINNVEDKLKCILLFLKSASIPWSNKVCAIANRGAEADHELAKSISIVIVHAEIKSILLKYKCHEMPFEDYEYLIRHIIRKGDPLMLADIEKVTSLYSSLRDDAYLMCIQRYLQSSQVHLSLKLYNQLEDSLKVLCVNSMLLKLENLLHSNSVNEAIETNYLDFLKSVYVNENNIILEHLYNIFILKNKLKFKISLSEYSIREIRHCLFKHWCKGKSEKLEAKEDNITEILTLSIKIGTCLKLAKAESVLYLLHEIDSQEIQKALANILFSNKSWILDDDIRSVNIIVKLINHIDLSNINFLRNSIKHILKIIQNCNYMHLSTHLINVCSWMMAILYSHNNCKELLSTWKICSFYNPHIISSIVPLWGELMSKSVSSNDEKKFNLCICKSDCCCDGSVCFKKTLTKLQLQQNDIHFSRIVAYYAMYCLQNDLSIPNWLTELNNNSVNVLISKMLSFEQPDHLNISMMIFCHFPVDQWLSEMLTAFVDTQKKINVAHYILQCKEMFKHVSIPYKQAFTIYSQNNIASKLERYGISFKECTQENTIGNINTLLKSLVNVESFNYLTLEEFCLVTGISLDQALIFYLFSLFKSWKPKYDIATDHYGDTHIVVEPIGGNMLQKCIGIIERIQRKDDLIKNLTTLLSNGEINFQNLTTITLCQYSYEIFLLIINILKRISNEQIFLKEFMLLKFLQTYKRVSKPKQTELDVYSVKETFPKIGFYRLPFQSLISTDCWINLKSELTLASYERWLPVAGLLPLDVDMQVRYDMICSSAVRESMTSRKSLNESVGFKWSLNLQNDFLLKQAHKCIQHITNLEWAGACFYYVYQGSAVGADQVAAANMCYQFAEYWSKIQPNNVLKKMQSKHLLTLTAHILHKIGLTDEKLLSLCDNPQRLIEALYNHDSILTYTECPNINAAIDEIAESNGLNSSTIRMNVLEQILNQSNNSHSRNSGVHAKSKAIDNGTLSKETLMKACYILKGTNPMMAALYLSHIGLDETESLQNYNKRIRALQCLLSLADSDVIEKVTNFTVKGLWSKMWELYFTNCLCRLGLEFLTGIFLENKLEALQQIWDARDHNQSTVSLLMKVIFVYNLQLEDTLLDEITKEMLKFGMLSEIKEFVLSAKSFYSKAYIEAWSTVLVNPFKQLDTPLAGNQKQECYNTLKLLPACPVASQVDLTPMWHNTIKLGALDMAAVVLPHVSEKDRKQVVAKFGKIQPSLLNDIKSLKSKGILTTEISLAILKQNYRNRLVK